MLHFTNNINVSKRPDFWKFNNSLISHTTLIEQMKSFISKTIKNFFENFVTKSNSDYIIVLISSIQLPSVSIESFNNCESDFTEESLLAALKSMSNNKTPGNNGLLKNITKRSGTK